MKLEAASFMFTVDSGLSVLNDQPARLICKKPDYTEEKNTIVGIHQVYSYYLVE